MSQFKFNNDIYKNVDDSTSSFDHALNDINVSLMPEAIERLSPKNEGKIKECVRWFTEDLHNNLAAREYSSTQRIFSRADIEVKKRQWLTSLIRRIPAFRGDNGKDTVLSDAEKMKSSSEFLARHISALSMGTMILMLSGVGYVGRSLSTYSTDLTEKLQENVQAVIGLDVNTMVFTFSICSTLMLVSHIWNGAKMEVAKRFDPQDRATGIKGIMADFMMSVDPDISSKALKIISDGNKVGLSSSEIMSNLYDEDRLSFNIINDLSEKIRKNFLIPKNKAIGHTISMMEEVKGQTSVLCAKLITRDVPTEWIKKFDIDELALSGKIKEKAYKKEVNKQDVGGIYR